MISFQNVSKAFGRLKVLDNITLDCLPGECLALIGPNGCGKTTLIKCILGMVLPDQGIISFNGKTIREQHEYRNQIGFMPQIGRYPDNMTIGQIIEMMKEMRRTNQAVDNDLYNWFDLDVLSHKKMRTLSGGTTQKISATLAFLFNPDVLILDEPTAGLDPVSSELLKQKIQKEKQKGKLILMTSHTLSDLDGLATGIIFMNEGRVQFKKGTEELMKNTGQNTVSKAILEILKPGNK